MYEYSAHIQSVYDGDGVFEAVIDLGMKMYVEKSIRLKTADTPELRGEQKEAGTITRDYVRSLILDKDVVIRTYKSCKFGRVLVDVIFTTEDGFAKDLSTHLIDIGYARRYTGGKKEAWSKEEISRIISEK